MAQLSINRLRIPGEIQDIIKDYALPTKERKRITNVQLRIFHKIKLLPKLRPPLGTIMCVNGVWMISDELIIYNRKYMSFCKKCGNYRRRFTFNQNCKIRCEC